MTKYLMLLNILDKIREEAASTNFKAKYVRGSTDTDQINKERARSFVHLYLKVSFGVLDFTEREHFVTDGPYDGGVDGYYIDRESRMIYFIQSKFRTSEENFTSKKISLEELLAMDVGRIIDGHAQDEKGNNYSGKILGLQREMKSIEDIARYKYKVIILANLEVQSSSKLSRIVGGLPFEVIDWEKCYDLLVFPVISGTYFNAADLVIHLDLSNKNAGTKISYTVDTRFGECDITALFVPTLEIARTFHKYKNSILKYNPRSYLELEGDKVNQAIRNTILQQGKNEFALYNNGITMLSDETHLNERIGQRNKAQLNLTNPQIINGGQTAYTLSRIYEELGQEQAATVFEGKEVLLKIITFNTTPDTKTDDKLKLIEAVSAATNLQTTVINADRYSNEPLNLQLQKIVFERYGLLYERKRGEFADGVHNGYIEPTQIIERNLFFRILFAANGDLTRAVQKRLFIKLASSQWVMPTDTELDRFNFGFSCFRLFEPDSNSWKFKTHEIYAQVFVMTSWFMPHDIPNNESAAIGALPKFKKEWDRFVDFHAANDKRFTKMKIDRGTQVPFNYFQRAKWIRSHAFRDDVQEFFEKQFSH